MATAGTGGCKKRAHNYQILPYCIGLLFRISRSMITSGRGHRGDSNSPFHHRVYSLLDAIVIVPRLASYMVKVLGVEHLRNTEQSKMTEYCSYLDLGGIGNTLQSIGHGTGCSPYHKKERSHNHSPPHFICESADLNQKGSKLAHPSHVVAYLVRNSVPCLRMKPREGRPYLFGANERTFGFLARGKAC